MANYVFAKFRSLLRRPTSEQTIRISMLGPSGVGKTSLLATMYDQLENVITKADLQVAPDPTDAAILDDQIVRLRRLFATDGLVFDPSLGIQGSADWRSFDFGLGRRGKKAIIQIQFVDYPGGWIESTAGDAERDFVLNLLRDSDAILVPIDAPALMERDGLWHRERNRPDAVFNLIQAAYEDLRSPRLVILAPIRCERYLNDPQYEADLAERSIGGYTKLVDHLSFGELANLVALVIAPVQTLGEIEFHGSPKNRYAPAFVKMHPDAVYRPQDSEQPLRFLLRFAMRLHQDKRDAAYFAAIRRMFKSDSYLLEATNAFAAGCKFDSPFVVLQGQDWLSIGDGI